MEIKKVGIVGCGLMGSGIAELSARAGYGTVVSEANDELLKRGLTAINSSLSRGVERQKITEADKTAALGRIQGTTKLEDFKDCDLVIEAIIEDIEIKKKVFAQLDGICPRSSILATNTSCLSIIEMAMATQRPEQVLGIHFFNPAPVMRLAELVKTIATSEETIQTARTFAESLGKTPILATDAPGFVVNRLLIPYMLDAVRVLEAGLATKEDIDQGMVLGCNHPMGPFTLADLTGLDTLYFVANAMFEEFKEPRFAPPVLLRKMVTAGRLGRKTGKGFYDYK
jgi:3-hydroxybutyryl-CoA dehydrogenase